jgi:catechol 2,3-dioxygenase-like lactoylglutathione lyase family enzyme
MNEGAPSRVYFENSQPILRVKDMKAALAFYVDKLGFQNASWGTEDFTSVNRDRAGIYLCRGGQGRGGAWVWVGVEDATRLHDELAARGVAIRMALTNFNWALEFHVEDPDGNVLRFGSEPLAGDTAGDLPRWNGS